MEGNQRQQATQPETNQRKVGIGLGIGIFFIPFIFAWLTLRKGHSSTARIVSFAWLGFAIIAMVISPDSNGTSGVAKVSSQSMTTTPTESSPKAEPPPKPKTRWISDSCKDMAKNFGMRSQLTDLQKKAIWKQQNIEGSHFEWMLQVQSVDTTFGKLQAQFKCKGSNAFVSDIILGIDDEPTALKLIKGKFYKIHGTLDDWGNLVGLSGDLVEVLD